MDFDASVDYLKSHKRYQRAMARYAKREPMFSFGEACFWLACFSLMYLAT
jgi:hypothetical protein